MVDPVIEKLDPGSPDDLRAEINYLRSREAYFASALKVADGGQYRADWKAPLQRVLDENKALHAEVDALRDGQETVRLALVECLRVASDTPRTSPEARTMPTAALVKALGESVAMVNEAPVDPASRFAHAGMDYTCDYELRWVEGAAGAQKPAADGPGLWVVRRPNEKPSLVVVGEGAAPPVTRLDGSDPGWSKHADRTDWTWERLPEAHAAMARFGYGEGYTDGARTMRQDAAARLARQASERLAVSRNPKAGWHSRNLADAEAAVMGDAEREVRGLALPAPGVPRGE